MKLIHPQKEGIDMNEYCVVKIKKKYLLLIISIIVFICGFTGYYLWCSYHPSIQIHISDGPTGKANIKMEVPTVTIGGRGIAKPAAAIDLKVQNLVMQHDFFCAYIRDTYQASDIHLNMEMKDGKTQLQYSGTATTSNGKKVDIHKILSCDYALDATITHK